MDLVAHLKRQRAFSLGAFGPPSAIRLFGPVRHIKLEVDEEIVPEITRVVEEEMATGQVDGTGRARVLEEGIDVIILAFDLCWRLGFEPEEVVAALEAKQTKNERREWPDWRTVTSGEPVEHVRDERRAELLREFEAMKDLSRP